jgi:hypothetical protein
MHAFARSLTELFDRPMRIGTASLWFAGTALAVLALTSSMRRDVPTGFAFALVAAGLLVLGVAVLRSDRWALVISAALLIGQIGGAVGSGAELALGIDPRKAAELSALGYAPRVGILINLAFSAVGTALLAVAVARAMHARTAGERRTRRRP